MGEVGVGRRLSWILHDIKKSTRLGSQAAKLGFDFPGGEDLSPRLDGVLAALYLMFNEGYKASAGPRLLREELCHEAIRLNSILVAHPAGDFPRAHALLALMMLSAARFPSRLDANGDLLRLDEQDRSKWDLALISRGLEELVRAADGAELSEYHLEAGIAAIHSTSASAASTDWERVVRHYDALYRIKPSPVVALNRAVAVAQRSGPRAGLDAIAEIRQRDRLEQLYLLHAVVGELNWRLGQHVEAAESFRKALTMAKVGPEQHRLTRMLERSSHPEFSGIYL